VVAHDPVAMEQFRAIFPGISYAENPGEVLRADAVLIVTEWEVFNTLDYRNAVVIDGRRLEKAAREARVYEGVCW
jgi:UDPglucose 6-dehydrogenase